MTPSEVEQLLKGMERTGNLPKGVTSSSLKEMSKSLANYFNKISADKVAEFTTKAESVLKEALNTEQQARPGTAQTTTVGEGAATARGKLTQFLEQNGAENIGKTLNIDFFLRIPMEVASGAAQKLAQNWDFERLDAFPALEFHRVYNREIPRGSEKDPAGPDNAWSPDRWESAADESGDEDAARVFEETGRMIALKSSDIWKSLGDGAGGYSDTLGNDFPPFAFNSGYDVDEITREEAENLGLLDPGEPVDHSEIDLADLINI